MGAVWASLGEYFFRPAPPGNWKEASSDEHQMTCAWNKVQKAYMSWRKATERCRVALQSCPEAGAGEKFPQEASCHPLLSWSWESQDIATDVL